MNKILLLLLGACSLFGQSQKPNIILILVDDLGFSDLGCYGGEIETPNIDRLGNTGLRMTQVYNSARCCPTRAALMTGLYPHQTGVGFMTADNGKPGYRGVLNNRCVTTASLLQKSGYKTYLAGKWHLRGKNGSECTPTNRGFDEFYGPFHDYASFYRKELYFRLPKNRKALAETNKDFYATDAITDYALSFIDEARSAKQPYYLYLAYNAPHFPLQAPKELIDKYVKTYEKGWDHIRETRFQKMQELGIISKNITISAKGIVPKVPNRNKDSQYYGKEIPAWNSLDLARRKDLTRRMATFAAMVDSVDQNIGRVLKDLEENNELDNTCIFFLSDNGACAEWDPHGFDNNPYPQNLLHEGDDLNKIGQKGSFHSYGSGWANACNTPLSSYKHYTYEGGISSPTIIHFPSELARKGTIAREPQHVIDIAATILDIAEVTYPKGWHGQELYPIQGKSLLPFIKGQKASQAPLYFEHEGNRAIRQGKWKLLWINYTQKWQLYNIDNDRSETSDLSSQHPEKVAELSKMWNSWAEKNFVAKEKIKTVSKGMPKLYYTPTSK
ncbi:arylsulfatase [Lentisphaera profundi]|uniref:Arylsulfatase n=1 Tax=Lentisphaera profundi TaxID=1658616 RepID=A0ABY7VYC8_9BACT|nr:arylsulfatase [Lentisphaera profundi]WDE99245.1 arylsulfatase [Lentisphaera profundi]